MKSLCEFLDASVTSFHAIKEIVAVLEEKGFKALSETEDFDLAYGGKYYVVRNSSSLIAFVIPSQGATSFQMAAAHSDSPSFRIKGVEKNNRYTKLKTEVYGGPIPSTWFDRPLSIAGRVFAYDENKNIKEVLVKSPEAVVIPSLASHINREAKDGKALVNPAVDLLPLVSDGNEAHALVKMLSENGIREEDVLAHDLFLCCESPSFVWGDGKFITSPRLDDLMCAYGLLAGFVDALPEEAVALLSVFDNEEIGSRTKQGADSSFLLDILERIAESLGKSKAEQKKMLAKSFMVSADNAHAVHLNHPEFSDKEGGAVYMNDGIVIKHSARTQYATDAFSDAILSALCQKCGIPYQHYYNRADLPGGSTLGNISCSHVSVPTADIGLAQLAMHSAVETAGAFDAAHLKKLSKEYFSHTLSLEGGVWCWNK